MRSTFPPSQAPGSAGSTAWTRRCRCPPYEPLPAPTSAPQRRTRRRVENAKLFHRNPANQLGGGGSTAWTRRCRCPPYEPLPAPTSAPQRRTRRRVENAKLFHRNPANQLGGGGSTAWTRLRRCPPYEPPACPDPLRPNAVPAVGWKTRSFSTETRRANSVAADQPRGQGAAVVHPTSPCLPRPSAPQRRARRRVENVRSTFPPKPGTRQRRTNRVEKAAPPPPYPSSTALGSSGLSCVASP